MTDLDIRETVEARREKAAVMVHEDDYGGYECAACGKRFPLGSDEIVFALGVGGYHVEHLSEAEIEYVQERSESDEQQLDALEVADEIERSNAEIYGDAATRGPQ